MKFALIGNPNSGKTTLFNTLTGANARVGNWPGVTVEKKEGLYKKIKGHEISIIDLPGIYSLSPYTPEEVISRNYLLYEKPDLVINIVDASNLERNLYLTTQLIEMDINLVVALNMIDVVEKEETKIDCAKLEKELGIKVVPISALKATGVHKIMEIAVEESSKKRRGKTLIIDESLNTIIDRVRENIGSDNGFFKAIKMIENDELEIDNINLNKPLLNVLKDTYPSNVFENDFGGIIADARYQVIVKKLKGVITRKEAKKQISKSDKIDKILTNKWLGLPIFAAIMFLVFHLTFSEQLFFIPLPIDHAIFGTDGLNSPGVILFNLMELLTSFFGETLAMWMEGVPEWVGGLLVDGLWGGLSAILSFIPQILCLYFFISVLEDSGYMARIAFIMDRLFRKFGLSGKSFLPLLMCFGCAVPGIMATRTLENAKEKRLTIMLTPFFSCGAKLPIWAVFAGIMYQGNYADFVVFGIYGIGIVVSIVCALILANTVFVGDVSPFVMELPAYHAPTAKNVSRNLLEKLRGYIVRAGTIIAGAIVVIWFFSSFGFSEGGFGMVDIGDSMLGVFSKWISYAFYPLGFAQGATGYLFVVAAFTGLIAKEMVPATLGAFVGLSEEIVLSGESLLGSDLANFINSIPVAAQWSFMIFNLLVIPCMAAVATARKELGSKKSFWLTIVFWLAVSYIVSMMVFYGLTYVWLGFTFVGLVVVVLTTLLLRTYLIKRKTRSRLMPV